MKIYFAFVVINLIVTLDWISGFVYLNSIQNDTRVGLISGNYTIGALFPIRESVKNRLKCGNISDYGIQIVEAAFFAVDCINRNESILPNVTLGIEIRDYCNILDEAQVQSKKFIDTSSYKCKEIKNVSSFTQSDETSLIGIIGPENYVFFKEVGSVLNFFEIVHIIYSEPLPQFASHEIDHPFFFSVIPEKYYTIDAIFEFLIANNWTYISVVYSEELLEFLDLDQFKSIASQKDVCIGDEVSADFISSTLDYYNMKDESSEKKKNTILEYVRNFKPSLERANVIVCYCSPNSTNSLFSFMEKFFPSKRFVVISGDGWPRKYFDERVVHRNVAVGEIVVNMEEDYVKEFDDYFLKLDFNTNERNPWSAEFWQRNFNGTNRTQADGYKQNPKIPYIIKSIFVLAHALHNMMESGCEVEEIGNFNQLCFRGYAQRVTFDFYGKSFKFEALGPTPNKKKYNFYNLQYFENGSSNYVEVGEYITEKDEEVNNSSKVRLNGKLVYPENEVSFNSTCRMQCSENQTRAYYGDKKCCWRCVNCGSLQFITEDLTGCANCQDGFESSPNKTSCIKIPTKYIKWHEVQTLVSILFSSLNIFLALFTFYIFVKYKNTPVVKSSTKELCYMMLFGIFCANLTPFTILRIPDPIDCVIVRILPPISFTFIYAALLIKTNRVARILAISQKKFPNLNPRFLSLKAQVVFTILLIIVEVLICWHSLLKNSIEPRSITLQKEDSSHYIIQICELTENILMETFSSVAILILICTYYAIKTRNLPENFNEAKYIGFAMYATILTDVAFGLIYFENKVKILALNLCISVNTFIVLVFLFAPKLYVILRMPEKNTRANFITTTSIRCFIASDPESSEENRSSSINRRHRESIGKKCESCMRRNLQNRKSSSISTID